MKVKSQKLKVKSQNGIALIIVVSIMAVLASIAAAFSYSMIMDQRAAANYMNGIKADYVAKAGIQHAIGVLKKDGDPSNQPPAFCSYEGYDWYGDDWGCDSSLFGIDDNTLTVDSCISNDDNVIATDAPAAVPLADSRWIYMTDSQGKLIGRYAVLVIDESGKVNINTAGTSDAIEGWTTAEVNLASICNPSDAGKILAARYGTDGSPGVLNYDDNHDSVVLSNDGIDNNGVGGIDETDEGIDDSAEFYIPLPYTSGSLSADTPYITVGEVVSLAGLSGDDYSSLDTCITAFSSDKNLTDSGLARLNINAVSSAMELYSTLRDAFDYWETSATDSELAQMAVNIIDFRDRDNGSTRIDIEGPGGTVLTRYGVEGIRINEVMVRPVFRKTAPPSPAECNDDGSGGLGWTWSAPNWENSGGGADTAIWSWSGITPGTYKVFVYGTTAGNVACAVYPAPGESDDWSDKSVNLSTDPDIGDTVVVGAAGIFKLNISTDNAVGDYWYHIELSQSPDCEYVELVNISPSSIDVGGWHLEFPNGQVGTIPGGTSIAAMGDSGDTIVLAIDMADSTIDNGSEVYNNGIYFTKTYTSASSANVYQLDFTNDVQDDILCDTVLVDSPLRLYDDSIAPTIDPTTKVATPAGHIVDQVLWDSVVIQDNDFYSMERDDPAYLGTEVLNDSGIFDSWLISASIGGSPTKANNDATSTNIKVKNSPFANIGEVADVAYSKTKWTNIGGVANRIKSIADRITVSGRRLDAEFADLVEVTDPGHWRLETLPYNDDEIKRKYGRNLNDSNDKLYWFKAEDLANSNEDTWTWYTTIDRFEADTYIMYVYGREGGAMRVRVDDDTALIIPSSDYGARFGQVVVSDTTLSVAIQADASSADSVYFDYVLLTPASKTYGRININTAGRTVLQALTGINSTTDADDIIDDTPFKTIGELVTKTAITTTTFQPISNLITTKSNVFKIICTGQSILDKNGNGTFDVGSDEVLGERKITVIYER